MRKRMGRRQFIENTGIRAAAAMGMVQPGARAPGPAGEIVTWRGQTDGPTANAAPLVEATAMISGAMLADSFDSPHLDTSLWSRPNWLTEHNPYIAVGPEYGRLVISGLSRPAGTRHQYIGVISKFFRETDVVLVSRILVRSPFEKPGRIQHHVHLCTELPDFFTEIIFGKITTGPPRWFTAYLDRIWVYSGLDDYVEPVLPATGTEAAEWHTVVIEHDGSTGRTQNYLIVGEEWKQVGPAHVLKFSHTHVELKVDVNVVDAPIYTEFDDVRLYPNPAHHPVTIVVNSPVIRGGPEFRVHNLHVRIRAERSGAALGEATTDESGQARVLLPRNVVYPVAASIEIWEDQKPVLRAWIPQFQVRGLYPGDVWVVRIPSRP